ncbi:hypothetical protein GJ744_008818 [Endocarpon pusillum]|uniref:Uncharacterized protein n=1 Tax=Endocarpon pusillum TaxID=364733 RepID=A0A8H7ASG3_9EURO|nr:hypothetical protein GJ744_008818 [Endocarpon pusillum]
MAGQRPLVFSEEWFSSLGDSVMAIGRLDDHAASEINKSNALGGRGRGETAEKRKEAMKVSDIFQEDH